MTKSGSVGKRSDFTLSRCNLLERDDFYGAGDLVVLFRREMDDPLVRAAAEMQLGVAQSFYIWPVHENIQIWEKHLTSSLRHPKRRSGQRAV